MTAITNIKLCRSAGPYQRWWNDFAVMSMATTERLAIETECVRSTYEMLNRATDPWGQCRIGAMEISYQTGYAIDKTIAAINRLLFIGLVASREHRETGTMIFIHDWDESEYQDMRRRMERDRDAEAVASLQTTGGQTP